MIIKYLKVGVINTLLTLLIIFILVNYVKLNYNNSYFIGYIFGLINSFILNKSYTFKSKNCWKNEIFPFIGIFILSYVISHSVLFIMVEYFVIEQNIAIIFSMAIYTIIGFYLNKKLFLKEASNDYK